MQISEMAKRFKDAVVSMWEPPCDECLGALMPSIRFRMMSSHVSAKPPYGRAMAIPA
jgi:hypothetical protein